MIHWFLMFIISSGGGFAKTIVKENYEGSHDGWFEIQLASGGKTPHLIHVEWCSELYQGASTDIDDCKAHNLIRKTIYPDPGNVGENNFDITTKPGTLRLNPNLVSGFWIKRQTDIVIEMEKEGGGIIVQVVRINPPPHAKAKEIIEEKQDQDLTKATPTPSPTFVKEEATSSPPPAVAFDFRSLGSGPFILLGLVCGFVFLVTALAIVRNKNKKKEEEEEKTISPVYNFETNNGIKLVEEEEEEEEKRKKEDQAFFMTLVGDSDREAFFLNIK